VKTTTAKTMINNLKQKLIKAAEKAVMQTSAQNVKPKEKKQSIGTIDALHPVMNAQ
jgi:Holliday junction resolvasome RuvABC DNA-binding subunit